MSGPSPHRSGSRTRLDGNHRHLYSLTTTTTSALPSTLPTFPLGLNRPSHLKTLGHDDQGRLQNRQGSVTTELSFSSGPSVSSCDWGVTRRLRSDQTTGVSCRNQRSDRGTSGVGRGLPFLQTVSLERRCAHRGPTVPVPGTAPPRVRYSSPISVSRLGRVRTVPEGGGDPWWPVGFESLHHLGEGTPHHGSDSLHVRHSSYTGVGPDFLS